MALAGAVLVFSALWVRAQEREPVRNLDEADQILAAPATVKPKGPDQLPDAPKPEPVVPSSAPAASKPEDTPAAVPVTVAEPAAKLPSGPEFLPPASIDDLLSDTPTAFDPAQAPTLGMLEGTWRELLTALRGGRLSAAAPLIDQVERLGFLLGIENMPNRSTALIQMAQLAAKNGDRDLMTTLLDEAQRLSPRLAAVSYARFRIALDQGDFEPPALMAWFRTGVQLQLHQISTYLSGTSTLIQALAYAFQLAGFMIALVLLYRTHMALASDLAHWLHGIEQVPFWLFRVMVLLLALIPVAMGFGVVGTAAVWLLMSSMYLTNRESAVLFVTLAALASVPALAHESSTRAATARSVPLTSVIDARYGEPTMTLERLLTERVAEVPTDEPSLYSLGTVSLKRRNYATARDAFQKVISKNPNFWQATVNLAVVEAHSGNPVAALDLLEQASRIGGSSKWIQFNRGRVLELMGPEREAEALNLLNASKAELGPAVWTGWTKPVSGIGEVKLLATFPLSDRYIWNHRLELLEGGPESAAELFHAYTGGSGDITVVVLLCAVAVLVIQLLRRRIEHSHMCESCGTWIRARPGHFLQSTTVCPQCIAVLYRSETVEPSVLLEKRAEIKTFQRRKRQIWSAATFVAPGAGEMGRGRLGIGALFLAVSSVIVSFWLQGGIVTGDPWSLGGDPSFPFKASLLVGGLLFYLGALWHFFVLEEN